jgi:hypothetical protein
MELFSIHRDGGNNADKLSQSSPLLTPLMASGGIGGPSAVGSSSSTMATGAAAGSAAAAKAAFDAGSLGEKLLSAARDIGTVNVPTGSDKATINENLRNFGKFFKRDIGGLGVRFGKRDGSVPDEQR